jgi:hypothetical protein
MRRIGLVSVIGLLLTRTSAMGTLIMAFCNGDTLYLGSDSLAISSDGSYPNLVQKIRPVALGCCFSATGVAGWDIPAVGKERAEHFDCLGQMEQAFLKTFIPGQPVPAAITNAVRFFERDYKSFFLKTPPDIATNLETIFTFWSYDESSGSFFGLDWNPKGTNSGVFHSAFDSRTSPSSFYFQGEPGFLEAFLRNHNDFPTVELSGESKKTWDKIVYHQPVSEKEIISEMVELFAVHKKYSAQLKAAPGLISEPYVIWRLRKGSAEKLGGWGLLRK